MIRGDPAPMSWRLCDALSLKELVVGRQVVGRPECDAVIGPSVELPETGY